MGLVKKWSRTVALGASLALVLAACTGDGKSAHEIPETTLSDGSVSQIEESVAHAMAATKATEAVVGVWSEEGDFVSEFTVGDERDINAKALFKTAQTNQPILCALTLSLASSGELDLDREVSRDIPRQTGIGNTTYRQLCEGTSPLPDFKGSFKNEVLENPTRPWPQGELLAAALIKKQHPWPGLDVHRSDTNAIVLAKALSVIAKGELQEMIEEQVFEPAQMHSTYISPKSELAIPNANSLAGVGYLPGPNCEAGPVDFSEASVTMLGYAGNTVSTVSDIKRFYEHLFTGTFGGEQGLTTLTTTKSTKNPKRDENGEVTEEAKETTSLRGFGVLKNGPLWGYDGSMPGSATAAWHDPEKGFTVVVALNSSAAGGSIATQLAHEIAATLLGEHVPWTAESKSQKIQEMAVCQDVPSEDD